MKMDSKELGLVETLLFMPVLSAREFVPVTIAPSQQVVERVDTDRDRLVSWVGELTEGASLADLGGWKGSVFSKGTLMHFSEVTQKQARLLNVAWFPRMHHFGAGALGAGDSARLTSLCQGFCVGIRKPYKVFCGRRGLRRATPDEDAEIELLRVSTLLLLLQRRYCWTVSLRVDTGPVVEFLTTSEEARQVFKWRDKPPGVKRRPALRHWVSQLGADTGQREPWYLRGAVDFTWEGILCKLTPPKFEREKLIARSV